MSFFLNACSTMKDVGYASVIPFAAIGDTVIVPFQAIGEGYEPLFALGDDHKAYVYEANKTKATLPLAELTSLVYYIPGAACWPFHAITPEEYYPMTKACVRGIQEEDETLKEAKEETVKERDAPAYVPDHPAYDEFREW